jgi:hypothetical protein
VIFFFHNFYTILHFDKFCRMRCLDFLNSVLTKNLKMDSSFFRIFYFKIVQIFEILKFNQLVFRKPVNRSSPVFEQFFNPWLDQPYI